MKLFSILSLVAVAGLMSVSAFAERYGSVAAIAHSYETTTSLDACDGTITTKLSNSRKSVHVYFSANQCSRVEAGDGYRVQAAGKLNTESKPYYGEVLVLGDRFDTVKEAYITLKSKSGKTQDRVRIYWLE